MAHATVFKHTPDRRTNSATDNQQLSPTTGESCTWGLQLGGGAMKGTNSGGALTGGSRSWLMLGTVGYLLSCYSASSAREESPSSTRRIRQHRYFFPQLWCVSGHLSANAASVGKSGVWETATLPGLLSEPQEQKGRSAREQHGGEARKGNLQDVAYKIDALSIALFDL